MRVYVTKWALSRGIRLRYAKETSVEGMLEVDHSESSIFSIYIHKSEWHKTWEKALMCAEAMRMKRIASLEKQLIKVRGLKFKRPDGDAK